MPTKSIVHALRRKFTKSFVPEVAGPHHGDEKHAKHKDLVRKEKTGRGINTGTLTGFSAGGGNNTHAQGPRDEKVLRETVTQDSPCPLGCLETNPHFLFRSKVN